MVLTLNNTFSCSLQQVPGDISWIWYTADDTSILLVAEFLWTLHCMTKSNLCYAHAASLYSATSAMWSQQTEQSKFKAVTKVAGNEVTWPGPCTQPWILANKHQCCPALHHTLAHVQWTMWVSRQYLNTSNVLICVCGLEQGQSHETSILSWLPCCFISTIAS